ncbi:unnamed protein product [Cuscuta epithymum]|uniref:Uncharacterized protein n=1 Tax=Cuscuta epithymum TaxID=186058 RepID=A0AAV0F2Q0_9ASTE|nr:unnamed protein product [Cuscuta epithymum]
MKAFVASSTLVPPPLEAIINHPSTTNFPFHEFKICQRFILKSRPAGTISPRRNLCVVHAGENNGDRDVASTEEKGKEKGQKNNMQATLNLKWVELLLDPDPENIVAVGLTGLLAWAGVQILWQLFVISLAILVAALKYSFIAALLIVILITLL